MCFYSSLLSKFHLETKLNRYYKRNFNSKLNQIPTLITQIWKYFLKGRSKREGGLVFVNFLLAYDEDIENIIPGIKY